ncbi:MAG: hypothetical protein GEU93_11030 [Propionibacteriales bacterium]|nr:hypothetical protein [Propionibacteriales bacterium]
MARTVKAATFDLGFLGVSAGAVVTGSSSDGANVTGEARSVITETIPHAQPLDSPSGAARVGDQGSLSLERTHGDAVSGGVDVGGAGSAGFKADRVSGAVEIDR